MNAERPLVEWARRFQTTCKGSPQHLREKMEATLVPMIRCAIRSGLGQPPLVRWVHDQLPLLAPDQQDDPTRHAGTLARELCDRLIPWLDPLPDRETVLGV